MYEMSTTTSSSATNCRFLPLVSIILLYLFTMLFSKVCQTALLSVAVVQTTALVMAGKPSIMIREAYKRAPLQDLVTWDEVCWATGGLEDCKRT